MLISKNDIINNKQSFKSHCFYKLGNMNACMDIGKFRKKQEDAVLLLEHPLIKEFKLLAVADGMGGLIYGSKASRLTLLYLIRWFESLPADCFYKDAKIIPILKEHIKNIDEIVRYYCKDGGSTLTVSIITKENTFFLNLGDSRIYVDNKSGFFQISEEHSITNKLYQKGEILKKDDMRFHKENNLITSRVGCEKPLLNFGELVLKNNEYNNIYLFTDGVTDCLSEEQLSNIVLSNKSKRISETIVNAALNSLSINNNLDDEYYYNEIIGGKDNTTAAVYKRILK